MNVKSILYKQKYYAISYKLTFIFKMEFIRHKEKFILSNSKLGQFKKTQVYNRFIFDKYVSYDVYNSINVTEVHYFFKRLHRNNKPAVINRSNNNIVIYEGYYQNGDERLNGPSILSYYNSGKLKSKKYRYTTNDKPSSFTYYENGNIEREYYYFHEMIHRDNLPAKIFYYKDGSIQEEYYYQYHQLHRLDGPAHIMYDKDGNIIVQVYCTYGKIDRIIR